MAKLTDPTDWDYRTYTPPPIGHFEQVAQSTDGWIAIARAHLPERADFIELECAPGYCSAAIAYGKLLNMHGIDFSASAGSYLSTLQAAGFPNANLIKEDLLNCQLDQLYDVVGSFGLIEHFSGDELQKILSLHDKLLRPGGKLIIEVPNFNGFPGLWHRIFDNPSYRLHNIAVMDPSTFDFFTRKGYTVHHCQYVGRLEVWGDSGTYASGKFAAKMVKSLEKKINRYSAWRHKIGTPLTGRQFSPALIYIATKPNK